MRPLFRRPVVLGKGNGMRIGIDLGGTKIEGLALAADGCEIARIRIPTPRGDYPGTVDAIRGLVENLEQRGEPGASVGVASPGAVSPVTGRMKNCNSIWLNGQPLPDDLRSALGREVRIANDADCFALSEAADGAGAGAQVVFGVIVGTGTGGGIVIRGALMSGPNAIAGEWGHNPLPWPLLGELPGVDCYCGRAGCIETWLSGPGFEFDHLQSSGQAMSAEAIVAASEQGDGLAVASLERYCHRMARSLASVVNLLDPDVIVLGGGMSQVGCLYRRVPELWSAYIFSDRVDTRLSPPQHGDSSGVRGAAWLWGSER